MITIINNILFNAGYKKVGIELRTDNAEAYLFCPSDESNREEYFVTIQLNMQSDESARHLLREYAQDLFDRICDSGKVERSFEKNCTMLVCQEEGRVSRKIVMMLEEDQYNFKKNVIAYCQKELEAVQDYLALEQISNITNNVINDIVNSDGGRKFLEFKNSHQQKRDHYSLIMKIVLKVPFITYYPQEQELISLDHEIETSLSPYLSSIYSQILGSDTGWDDDNILLQVERIWGGVK